MLDDQVPQLPEKKSRKRTTMEVASEGALGAIPEVVPGLVELEVAVPHLSPAEW